MPLYYEDLTVGQSWTSAARTVTEHDIATFAGLTSDMHPLHTDIEYCRTTRFGERIAHGFLVASLASGLGYRMGITEGTIIANLGTSWKFKAPTKINDTIRLVMTVKSMRLSEKNTDGGVVTRSYEVLNQRDEVVADGEVTVMFKRKTA